MRWLVIVIGLLGPACERGSVGAPEPLAMEPAVADEGDAVGVIIRGRTFWVDPVASFAGGGVEVDSSFEARLTDTPLLDVTYVDGETLTATVPGTLAVGVHTLTVVDANGREGALTDAFTVEASTVFVCERDEQCNDNDVCNGTETCAESACVPGADLDCDDSDPCTVDSCDPVSGCGHDVDVDLDGDGYLAASCGGDDCDDDPGGCGMACNPGAVGDPCDGFNNDCDLDTDEDHVETQTSCGVGACTGNTGVLACVSGVPTDSCDPLAGASADDDCDDLDDDCDGTPDDDWVDAASTCGVGACVGNTGTVTCGVGGVTSDSCDPLAGAGVEGPVADPSCSDGIDNDCDGPSDLADPGCGATGNLPPMAVAVVAPPIGITAVTTFAASAAGTTDDVDPAVSLTYDWDWENDGTFDDSGLSASHIYPVAGTYTVVLLVTDSGGLVDYAVFILVVADASDRILVTTDVDEGDAGATPALPGGTGLSLREAILYANGVGGAAIEVPAGMTVTFSGNPPSPVGVELVGDGATIDGSGAQACVSGPQDSLIAGLELIGCVNGVLASDGGNQLTRLSVHGTETAMDVGSGNVIGPDNEVASNTVGLKTTGDVNVWRNRIHDNTNQGVDHRSGSPGTRIWQNVVWSNGTGVWLGSQGDDAQVVFNTIVDNTGDGIFTSSNAGNLDVRNNILANNGTWGITASDGRFLFLDYNAYFQNGSGTCSNCTIGTHHTTEDPTFVNPGASDYRLHPSSMLIDAGVDIGIDVNDREPMLFNGSAPDMGAYEAP